MYTNQALGTSIFFLGDSLTEGLRVLTKESYPVVLKEKLSQKGINIEIIVDGISGSTSASGPSRLKKLLEKETPEYLFLALGANDGLRGYPTDSLKTNLEKCITMALDAGTKVILAGMQIPDNYGMRYSNEFKQVYQDLYAEYKGTKRLSFYVFLLEGVALNANLNQSDGIHPNAAGYEVIAENLLEFFIEKIIK